MLQIQQFQRKYPYQFLEEHFILYLIMELQKSQTKTEGSTSMKASAEFKMTKLQVLNLQDSFEAYNCCIKYLNAFNYREKGMTEFVKEAEDIMKYLNSRFSTSQYQYLPWIKFLDVAGKMVSVFMKELEEYKNKISNLIRYVLLNNGNKNINDADWRILRKMYSVQNIIQQGLISLIDKTKFIEGFKQEIDNSLKYLIWVQDSYLVQYTRGILTQLKTACNDASKDDVFINSIKTGRFDKKGQRFNKLDFLEHTLVLGEDGGLFLLLNTLDDNFRKALEQHVGKEYIKQKSEKNKNGKGAKVVIGKGSFGKVRFAINLFYVNKFPGDIICVKKTSNVKQLSKDPLANVEDKITTSTLEDYFASELSSLVYSPKVLDMAIVIERIQEVEIIHQKGYLFMEIVPQNTGTNIFGKSKYQKWQYQKPYLLDMFDKVNLLLKNKIAFTDLKPDNTLFNVFNRMTSLIDLGGTVKNDDLAHYEGSYQFTKDFSAPEIVRLEKTVNLVSTVSYACGAIVKYLSKNTDFSKKTLQDFADRLMNQRISLEQASKQLERIGDDGWKQAVIFTNYINRVQARLQSNKSSININEDINETIKTFIPLNATPDDPYKFANQNTIDLLKQIDEFLKQKAAGVFLLLGKAGSGKSVVLQQKFIQCIHGWSVDKPLPIFFNLANNTSLTKILQALDEELITNLQKNIKSKPLILFIDSFDEGVDMEKCRQTLINDYFSQLSNEQGTNMKIIVSCRSDYIQEETNQVWFQPKKGTYSKYYITSLNYLQNTKWNDYIRNWCKLKNKENKVPICIENITYFKNIIQTGFLFQIYMEVFLNLQQNLARYVTAIELYKLYVKYYIVNHIDKLNKDQRRFIKESFIRSESSLLDARLLEVGGYLATKMHVNSLYRIKSQDAIFSMLGYKASESIKFQKAWFILKLLPLKIQTKQSFTTKYDFKQEITVGFIHDTIKNTFLLQEILKELRSSGSSSVLSAKNISDDAELVGLLRDTISNDQDPDLIKRLLALIDKTKNDKSPESITAAANATTILVAAQICLSGQNFSNISIKGANMKNGVFQHSDFSNADLSGVNLSSADLVGCRFNGANMAGVELASTPMLMKCLQAIITIAYAPDSKTIAMSLGDGAIEIFQFSSNRVKLKLKGHEKVSYGLVYSKDGRRLASGSQDGTVKIWDTSSGNQLQQMVFGHSIAGICYSPDDKAIAAGGEGRQIKIFNAENGAEIAVHQLQQKYRKAVSLWYSPNGRELACASSYDHHGTIIQTILILDPPSGRILHKIEKNIHSQFITWVCYSPNGKYLASSSRDQTIKVWNAEKGYELIKTVYAHSDEVTRVCFSPNSKFIASGSKDRTIKIIDVQTSTVVKDMHGHYMWVVTVCYSPDSRFIVSGGGDMEVRMWDTSLSYSSLQNMPKVRRRIGKIGFRTGSKHIAVGFSDNSLVALYDMTDFSFKKCIPESNKCELLAIIPDFKVVLFTKNRTIYRYDIQHSKLTKKQHGDNNYLCFSNDCTMTVSVEHDPNSKIDFRLWNIETDKREVEFKKEDQNSHNYIMAAISNDKKLIALHRESDDPNAQKLIRIYNTTINEFQSEMTIPVTIRALLFSLDGMIFAAGGNEKQSIIGAWNPEDGDITKYITTQNQYLFGLTFFRKSNKILVPFQNLTLRLYDLDTSTLVADLYGHNGAVVGAYAFSEDERQVISASDDCTLRLWEIKNVDGVEKWCYSKSIIGAETPLQAAYAEMNNLKNISDNNFRVFQERFGKISAASRSNEPYNPRSIDNDLVKYRQLVGTQIERSLQIKKVEINLDALMNNEEQSEIYRKPELSLEIATGSPLLSKTASKKAEIESQSTAYNGYSGGDGDYESGGGCCCAIYRAEILYNNPLLNIRGGLQKAAKLMGKSDSETLQETSENASLAELLASVVRSKRYGESIL